MMAKYITLFILLCATLPAAQAQRRADSTAVANTWQALLNVCKNVDFANPQTIDKGMFYKAAQYIIYRGNDKKRAWKTFANYNHAAEKKAVDEICIRINETINRDSNYHIKKYLTEKESEGTWHVLIVHYQKNGMEKEAAFAFLKIGRRFAISFMSTGICLSSSSSIIK
jgi:hypothetical protein